MKLRMISFVITLCLLALIVGRSYAGSSGDYGTVPGTPPLSLVNWTAWLNKTIGAGGYPSEVLTEDNTNCDLGENQGYLEFLGGPKWLMQVENFSNEAANDAISMTFGGLGSYSGYVWEDHFNWDISEYITDQGEATVLVTDRPCPRLTMSERVTSTHRIAWEAAPGTYHVYCSQNESGAGNGASNGRYFYRATVVTTGYYSGHFEETVPDPDYPSWYIVIPADPSGAINGCHSEPGAPTAISLQSLRATGPSISWALLGVPVLTLLTLFVYRRRLARRTR